MAASISGRPHRPNVGGSDPRLDALCPGFVRLYHCFELLGGTAEEAGTQWPFAALSLRRRLFNKAVEWESDVASVS